MRTNTKTEFYKITQDKPASELLIRAVELLGHTGEALDLGAGAGRDAKYLLDKGFHVTVVEKSEEAIELLKENLPHQNVIYIHSLFEEMHLDGSFDLINAAWSLPFIQREKFEETFLHILSRLNPGGIFCGQLFGIHDEWNTPDTKRTFQTKEEVTDLFKKLEVIELKEEEKDGTTANGTPKHWHVFHFIVRK